MSRDLKRWFKSRRTSKVLQLVHEHSEKALQVTDEFLKMVEASINGRYEELEKIFKREQLREREGDALRRKIMDELAKGELPPEEREYFMRLARQIDLVADYAHGAGRILTFLPLDKADEVLKEKISEMCSKTRDCVMNLNLCTAALLENNLEAASRYAEIVEELEEDVDEMHMETRKTLLRDYYSKVDARIVNFFSEFLQAVEDTSDRCEDSSDQIKVIIVYLSRPSD